MDFHDFIRKLSDVQAYIQNEKLLRELKSSVNANEDNENQHQINKILRKLKKYWLGQFLIKMERKYKNDPAKFQFSDKNYSDFFLSKQSSKWSDLKVYQQECLKQFNTDSFKQFCIDLKPTAINNDLISFISLSIAPSIYNFFISAKNYMYIELIFDITNTKIKKKFVKTLFLIPSFLHFVSTTFRLYISPFENNEKNELESTKYFIESLLQSWVNHMKLCPKFIRKYFENSFKQDSNFDEIFSLFKNLFKKPDILQITYFYNNKLPKAFYNANNNNYIVEYLRGNKKILKKFALSFFCKISVKDDLFEKVSYRNDLEEQDVIDEFTDIFLPDTFDSYDIEFLCDLINKNYDVSKCMPVRELLLNEYKFFIFSVNDMSVQSHPIENLPHQPLDSFKNCVKELLENSELLPDFPESFFKEKDPNFIENYLVYRGPFDSFSKRNKIFLQMKSLAEDPLKKLMKLDFDCFYNENNDIKRDENIYSTSLHKATILNYQKVSFSIQSQLFQILEYNFLCHKFELISKQKDFRDFSENLNITEMINDPKKLKEMFSVYFNYFQSFEMIPDFQSNSTKIDFKFNRNSYIMLYLTKNLTFERFLNERKNLMILDTSFIKMISSRDIEKNEMFQKMKDFFNRLDCVNSFNFLNKLNFFNKNDLNSINQKLLNEKFNIYSYKLRDAFSADTNPIQKIIDICTSLANLQNFIVEEAGADIERGDIIIVRDLILMIVKPKFFLSSFIFIFDYYFMICDEKSQLKTLFEEMFDIAYRNTKTVINNSIYQHLLICRKTLKIAFFGDDSKDSMKIKILSKCLHEANRNDLSFNVKDFIEKSKEITYYYLNKQKYYVCSIRISSINDKLDDDEQFDLAIFAFDENDQIFSKIKSSRKMIKNKFKNRKLYKEFTYVICKASLRDQLKKDLPNKIFVFNEKVMPQIIDDYNKSIIQVK